MSDLLDKIIEAKELKGDDVADELAAAYHVEKYDPIHKKGCCPFHREDTPSFIWNPKDKAFHCFGCGAVLSVLDYYVEQEGTYQKGIKRLFEETGIEFNSDNIKSDKEEHKDYFAHYIYPKEEKEKASGKALEYWNKLSIS